MVSCPPGCPVRTRLHDLIFALALCAAVGHLAWVGWGRAKVRGGLQELVVDAQAREDDAFVLETALAAAPARAGSGPDLVLIVLDGLRADAAAQMPELARFASRARRYDAARTAAPYAYASQASMSTGLLPSEHGGIINYHGRKRGMRPDLPTLAGRLAEGGWLTASISADADLAYGGVLSGFDVALDDELQPGDENLPYIQGDRVTDLAIAALAQRGDRPIFLQVRYADAELPWIVREGDCARAVPDPRALAPGGQLSNRKWRARRFAVLSEKRPPSPEELETWRNAYASELCFLDGELGRLLSALPSVGVGPEDWVVIVGSHGTFLGEHQLVGSGWDVYEEALRVPLMVRGPGLRVGVDDTPISTMNLARVLLAALGLPGLPEAQFSPPLPGALVSELHGVGDEGISPKLFRRFHRSRRAVLLEGYKALLSSDGAHEAYDLAQDPHELSPQPEAPRATALLEPLAQWTQSLLQLGGVR